MTLSVQDFEKAHKYGIVHKFQEPRQDSSKIELTLKFPHGDVHLEDFWYSQQTHEDSFEKTGFNKPVWKCVKKNENLTEENKAFWKDFEEYCPTIFFEAVKR